MGNGKDINPRFAGFLLMGEDDGARSVLDAFRTAGLGFA